MLKNRKTAFSILAALFILVILFFSYKSMVKNSIQIRINDCYYDKELIFPKDKVSLSKVNSIAKTLWADDTNKKDYQNQLEVLKNKVVIKENLKKIFKNKIKINSKNKIDMNLLVIRGSDKVNLTLKTTSDLFYSKVSQLYNYYNENFNSFSSSEKQLDALKESGFQNFDDIEYLSNSTRKISDKGLKEIIIKESSTLIQAKQKFFDFFDRHKGRFFTWDLSQNYTIDLSTNKFNQGGYQGGGLSGKVKGIYYNSRMSIYYLTVESSGIDATAIGELIIPVRLISNGAYIALGRQIGIFDPKEEKIAAALEKKESIQNELQKFKTMTLDKKEVFLNSNEEYINLCSYLSENSIPDFSDTWSTSIDGKTEIHGDDKLITIDSNGIIFIKSEKLEESDDE